MKLFILSLLLFARCCECHGEPIVPVDKAAHFGISYTVNTVAYAACKASFGEEHKQACLVSSALVTTAIGVTKEIADGDKNTTHEHAVDLLADGLGIAASILTIHLAF